MKKEGREFGKHMTTKKLFSESRVINWSLGFTYLFAITGIEIGLFLDDKPVWAIVGYGFVLISSLVIAALKPESSALLIGFSGIPIIRIVALGIPFSYATPTAHFGFVGLILLSYIIPAIRITEFAESQILKIPTNWLIQIFIIISGFVVGYCQFLVYPQEPLLFTGSLETIIFIGALVLLSFVEEVIFRGIALSGFSKAFSPTIGIILVSFIYTTLFIPFGSFELGIVIFLTSLFYSFAVEKFTGLYGVIGAHIVSSLLYYLILPTT